MYKQHANICVFTSMVPELKLDYLTVRLRLRMKDALES
jgi:hypothetical protein